MIFHAYYYRKNKISQIKKGDFVMNKVVLVGRLTKDPAVRAAGQDGSMLVARYTLAVDRRYHKDGEQKADFIGCVVFGRGAEFAEKYFHQGMKVGISGHIQTGSYTNREGQKVYTTDVIVDEQEFVESKKAAAATAPQTIEVDPAAASASKPSDLFQPVEFDEDLEELPFN